MDRAFDRQRARLGRDGNVPPSAHSLEAPSREGSLQVNRAVMPEWRQTGSHYTVRSAIWITRKQKYYILYGETRQSEVV